MLDRLRVGALGGAFGGGAIALTLMACYGMPPCDDGTLDCYDSYDSDAGDGRRDGATRPDVQVDEPGGDADASDGATDGASDMDAGDTDASDEPDGGDAG